MFVLCLPLALYTDEWLNLTLCIAHKVFTVVVSIEVTSYPPFKDFHAFFLPVLRRIAYKPLKRLGFLCTDAIGPFTLCELCSFLFLHNLAFAILQIVEVSVNNLLVSTFSDEISLKVLQKFPFAALCYSSYSPFRF